MRSTSYQPGDAVVLSAGTSVAPPPVTPAEPAGRSGSGPSLADEKYWVVDQLLDGGRLLLRTRRGRLRVVPERSAQLRPAHWWERIVVRARLPRS